MSGFIDAERGMYEHVHLHTRHTSRSVENVATVSCGRESLSVLFTLSEAQAAD